MKLTKHQIKISMEHLDLAACSARNVVVVIKDGRIYKNTVR